MIDKINLAKTAQSFATPCFVFDEDELTSRIAEVLGLLGNIPLCYSIKANPFLVETLIPVVDRFEVCSPGELSICRSLLVPPEKIIYSGVLKEEEDTKEAIEYGCAILTAESVRQFELIRKTASLLGRKVNVLLRLSSGNQFGMSLEDIKMLLDDPVPEISIIGLHYFAGTQRKILKKQQAELARLTEVIIELREKFDTDLPMLEYGPGLPFLYFTDEDFSDTLLPLKTISDDLKKTAGCCALSVEMGRFLASSCGYYITKIGDLKSSSEANWCITDGGINHVNYLGQMMGMKTPVITHCQNGEPVDDSEGETYTICGALCTTNDILVRSLTLKDPVPGDILIFSNIGAYSVTEGIGLFLSRALPRVIMHKKNCDRLVRDATQSWKINVKDTNNIL